MSALTQLRVSAGRALKQLRISAGLTQVELALRSGIAQPTISGIELGGHTTTRTLERLAQALDSTGADLLTDEPVLEERPLRAEARA